MFGHTKPIKSLLWMERAGINHTEVSWMEEFLEHPNLADEVAIKRIEANYIVALSNMLNSENRASIFMQAVLN